MFVYVIVPSTATKRWTSPSRRISATRSMSATRWMSPPCDWQQSMGVA
jgi:hypothetical protein